MRQLSVRTARSKNGERYARAEREALGAIGSAAVAAPVAPAAQRVEVGSAAARQSPPAAREAGVDLARPFVGLKRPRTLTPVAVRREVLKVLALEPCTAPDLMEVLNLGEGQVRQALRELCEEREVRHDALTAEGWRAQTWRIAGGAQP